MIIKPGQLIRSTDSLEIYLHQSSNPSYDDFFKIYLTNFFTVIAALRRDQVGYIACYVSPLELNIFGWIYIHEQDVYDNHISVICG